MKPNRKYNNKKYVNKSCIFMMTILYIFNVISYKLYQEINQDFFLF